MGRLHGGDGIEGRTDAILDLGVVPQDLEAKQGGASLEIWPWLPGA
jgi:hypothetical protein